MSVWLDAWLQNKIGSLWPIFHGSVIFALYLEDYLIYKYDTLELWVYDLMLDLKIKVGHCDLHFIVQWFLPYILKAIWCITMIPWNNEPVWLDAWPQNKSGSLWPMFHGSVILPYILKAIWCINMKPLANGSVWLDALPQNKSGSLWPLFHGSVILPYVLKAIWCINMIPWNNKSVWLDAWPQNKSGSLWPIFHGSVILAYILKTIWCIRRWHWPGVYVSPCSLALVWIFFLTLCRISSFTF